MFFVFPRVVTPDDCEQIIKDCKQNILEEASVLNNDKSSRDDPALRKTSINFIKDKDNEINKLAWHFLRKANTVHFNYEITHFQAIQFAEYKDGGFYGWHQDDIGLDKSKNEIRKLSLILILSNSANFSGGELQFYNGDRPIQNMEKITGEKVKNDIQSQGTIVVFDSRDWHRVYPPVTNGVRHSIVCWAVGPNFR